MGACELRTSCFFFNKTADDRPQPADNVRDRYCNGEYGKCARFIISKSRGSDNVPDTLSPDCFNRPKCFCAL
jgi:hypothetical protein